MAELSLTAPSGYPVAIVLLLSFHSALNAASRLDTPEARALLTGEAADRWRGPSIGPISGSPDLFVTGRGGGLATRVSSRMPDGSETDFYFYLHREGSIWCVEAMRTLALAGVSVMAREQLKSAPATPESTEYLRHIELTLSSDRRLRDWFVEHRADLEALVNPLPAQKEASICKELGLIAIRRKEWSHTSHHRRRPGQRGGPPLHTLASACEGAA